MALEEEILELRCDAVRSRILLDVHVCFHVASGVLL